MTLQIHDLHQLKILLHLPTCKVLFFQFFFLVLFKSEMEIFAKKKFFTRVQVLFSLVSSQSIFALTELSKVQLQIRNFPSELLRREYWSAQLIPSHWSVLLFVCSSFALWALNQRRATICSIWGRQQTQHSNSSERMELIHISFSRLLWNWCNYNNRCVFPQFCALLLLSVNMRFLQAYYVPK